jgi:hypothetical protein
MPEAVRRSRHIDKFGVRYLRHVPIKNTERDGVQFIVGKVDGVEFRPDFSEIWGGIVIVGGLKPVEEVIGVVAKCATNPS